VVNILIDNLVDLKSELLSNFSFLGSIDLAHEREEIMSTLRTSIGNIQVMKSNILNDFLLFVNITLRNRNILLSLKIIFGCVSIRTTNTLYGSTSRFNVNYITNCNLLLLNVLINAWVELQLFLSLGGLQAYDD
jgi:hypothetical protein